MQVVLPVGEARRRIAEMKPGSRMIYHVGCLVEDRKKDPKLDILAKFMLQAGLPPDYAYAKGGVPVVGLSLGHVWQERIKDGVSIYFFTKLRAKPKN